jgi:hypothetical protein
VSSETMGVILSPNIAPHISITLLKSSLKNLFCVKQAVSRCKMAGAGFHSFAKFCAQIRNAVIADRGVFHADCYKAICRTKIAIVRCANLRAECPRPEPPAGFVLGLRGGVGNPQYIGELNAKQ